MAKHVGCFWFRDAVLQKLLDFQPAVVFVDAGMYLYSKSGDITKSVLRFPHIFFSILRVSPHSSNMQMAQ